MNNNTMNNNKYNNNNNKNNRNKNSYFTDYKTNWTCTELPNMPP